MLVSLSTNCLRSKTAAPSSLQARLSISGTSSALSFREVSTNKTTTFFYQKQYVNIPMQRVETMSQVETDFPICSQSHSRQNIAFESRPKLKAA